MTIIVGLILIILNFLLLVYRYGYALYHVQEIILSVNFIYIIVASALPFLWWIYSTKEDMWHFYKRKKATLLLCVSNASACIVQILWTFIFDVLVVKICQIPTGRNLDAQMIFILCRLALGLSAFLAFYAIFALMRNLYENDEIRENIEVIRWQHLVDTRANKKTAYDLDILRKMEDGKKMLIYDVDRFVHMFILGSSGTGKTSSTITPAIICDFDQKVSNREKRIPLLSKFMKEGRGVVYKKEKRQLEEYDIIPTNTENKETLEKIRDQYPDVGATVMAPDNSLNVDVIKLAEVRDIVVNVIDPIFTYKNKNIRMKGLNPFFVQIGLEPEKRVIEIINKAQNFAEVLLAVSEIHGVGDQYFRDINSSVTTNISILCMLDANLNGRQTNIAQIQSCIADFGKLRPIVDDIQEKLHIHVIVHEVSSKKSARVDAKKPNMDQINAPDISELGSDDLVFDEIETEEEIPELWRQKGITLEQYNKMLREEGESYAENIHFALQELLGAGSEKMFDQARGLRNILQNLLMEPRVRRILSAPEESIIDFDKALANGEVTVVNTALELGPTSSTALGLFIMLSMNMAVLRRPAQNRTNHFVYIDESSQYMHPMFENMFALFRKYKVGVVMAIQSLSQMDKTDTTRYLKGVIMGAGIHIVFGRTDPDTMKYYEEIAGISHKETVQVQTSSNSEFNPNYNINSGRRKTVEEKQAVEGHQIRIRDFQEVTVFMVKKGQVLKGIHAKTSFPKKSDYRERKVLHLDLDKYAEEDPQLKFIRERNEANDNAEKIIREKYSTSQRVMNVKDEEDSIQTLPSFYGEDEKRLGNIADYDEIKQRMGAVSMLADSVNAKAYVMESEDDEDEPVATLDGALLRPRKSRSEENKKKTVQRVDKKKSERKNTVRKEDDIDFGNFLEDENTVFSDVKNEPDEEEYEDENDILAAELAKLNGERKDM